MTVTSKILYRLPYALAVALLASTFLIGVAIGRTSTVRSWPPEPFIGGGIALAIAAVATIIAFSVPRR